MPSATPVKPGTFQHYNADDNDDDNDDDEQEVKPKRRTGGRRKKVAPVESDNEAIDAMDVDTAAAADTTTTEAPSMTNLLQENGHTMNFWERKARAGPSAPGSKEIPVGEPNCLKGLTFVFTGELSSIARDEAADLVKRYSGRVTTAPSSRTSYVVIGEDAGEKKLEKVKALKLQTLNEDQLLDLIRQSKDMSTKEIDHSPVEVTPTVKETPTTPIVPKVDLWTDQLCGNKSNVERLGEWLRQWLKNKRMEHRAVLISGPPGIGKSTSARIVSINEGFRVVEFNASDTRNKKHIEDKLGQLISTRAMAESDHHGTELQHRVIIMDEVDGMSSGDRGGVAHLIQLIKKTRVPIICICNDRQSVKAASIRSRIMSIAYKEGLKLQPNAIDHLVASTHSDIRQILNILSAWKLAHNSLNYDEAKHLGERSEKHIALGPFDIIGKYLQGQAFNATSVADKLDLYFHDYSLVPLMVQDMDIRTMELIAKASESISQGDIVDKAIHGSQQQWGLMSTHALFSCVRPAYYMHGGMQGMYQFPSWLGQNSKAGKSDRQLAEIQARMRLRVACDKNEIRTSYVPILSRELTNPLITEGVDGIQSVIDLLDHYYLSREDWDALVGLRLGRDNGEHLMKQIPLIYNKSNHPTVVIAKALSKRDFSANADSNMQPDLEEAIDLDEEVPAAESDSDSMADDALIKSVKPRGSSTAGSKKGRGGSTSKRGGGGRSAKK
ncbi:replication factor RFC1 C terminal domain-containing protein [Syncephalis plumigaleata]|nr:replication factor RFC1 C terminal domain-containing protein [Syncephalis plumigaleata]